MPNPDPAHPDPRLAVWFAPEDIREHFKETDAEPRAAALSDAALADAAWNVIVDSDRIVGAVRRARRARARRGKRVMSRRACERLAGPGDTCEECAERVSVHAPADVRRNGSPLCFECRDQEAGYDVSDDAVLDRWQAEAEDLER